MDSKRLKNVASWEQHFRTQNELERYEQEIGRVFGSYGFITSPHNLHTIDNAYGWDDLYKNISGYKIDKDKIKNISSLRSRSDRLYFYEMGLVSEIDVYQWFNDLVERQNNKGSLLRNDDGRIFFAPSTGRFSADKKYRSGKMVKKFKKKIGLIDNAILLTLTTHQGSVKKMMPVNTLMSPVMYAICNIGVWISRFLKVLRAYQKRKGVPWEYVGYVLEMQDNGFPHVHMIFRGSWIGRIKEIAELWPYCELQGVDYMDKKKLEQKKKQKVKGLHLVNYMCGYVSKSAQKIIIDEKINRSWAYAAYFQIRSFNLAHEYRSSAVDTVKKALKTVWQWVGSYNIGDKTINVIDGLKSEIKAIYEVAPWSKTIPETG